MALEWAQWGRSREHIPGAIGEHVRPGYTRYQGSILAFSFSDDTFAPRATVDGLLGMFPAAERDHRHLTPSDVGRPVGHFGFFREEFRETLWKEAKDWLHCRAKGPSV